MSNNFVCATSKGSDQPAQTRSLIRAFASRLNIHCVLHCWISNVVAQLVDLLVHTAIELLLCHLFDERVFCVCLNVRQVSIMTITEALYRYKKYNMSPGMRSNNFDSVDSDEPLQPPSPNGVQSVA